MTKGSGQDLKLLTLPGYGKAKRVESKVAYWDTVLTADCSRAEAFAAALSARIG